MLDETVGMGSMVVRQVSAVLHDPGASRDELLGLYGALLSSPTPRITPSGTGHSFSTHLVWNSAGLAGCPSFQSCTSLIGDVLAGAVCGFPSAVC